jgi:putative spermidine/putrescine transport system permease protein
MDDDSVVAVPGLFRVVAMITLVFLLLPMVIVVLAGLNAGEYLTFPPQGLSLRWVKAFLGLGPGSTVGGQEAGISTLFIESFAFSFLLATVTTLASTVLGTLAALALTRYDFIGRSVLQTVFLSPLVLPTIVIGLGLFIYYRTIGLGLSRSFLGLTLGHVVVTMPYVVRTVAASLYHFDLSLEEAARSLRASPWTTFRRVTLPIIAPGIMAGSIFAFIVSFGQFDITVFLAIPNHPTLPLTMYEHLRFTFDPLAAGAGIFAITLVVISLLVTSQLTDLKVFAGFGKRSTNPLTGG